jgi:hypothetical protein
MQARPSLFVPSQPFPPFEERQAAMVARKAMTWEERMEEYEAKYGPEAAAARAAAAQAAAASAAAR